MLCVTRVYGGSANVKPIFHICLYGRPGFHRVIYSKEIINIIFLSFFIYVYFLQLSTRYRLDYLLLSNGLNRKDIVNT